MNGILDYVHRCAEVDMSYLQKIKNRVSVMMGTSVISANFMSFAGMHALFTFATTLSSVFISTFLFRENSSFTTVGLYYLFAFFFEACSYFFLTAVSGRLSGTTLSRIGLVLHTLSYLSLLIMQDQSVRFYPITAFLASFGAGFYWGPYHRYTISYSTPVNRQQSIGFIGFIGNFITLIAPIVSGAIISGLHGMPGYMTVFVVSIVSFISAALVSRKMPSKPSGKPPDVMWRFIKEKLREKPVYMNVLGSIVYGVREGVFSYFLNILIFSVTSNELIIGLNTTGRGVLAMVAYYFLGKIRSRKTRAVMMVASCILMPVLTVGLFAWYTAACMIIVNILDGWVLSVFGNSLNYVAYEMSDCVSRDGQDRFFESISIRNISLNIGRIVSITAFLLVPVSGGSIVFMLFLLSFVAMFSGFLLNSSSKASCRGET
jgi:YQGE family putative transporter